MSESREINLKVDGEEIELSNNFLPGNKWRVTSEGKFYETIVEHEATGLRIAVTDIDIQINPDGAFLKVTLSANHIGLDVLTQLVEARYTPTYIISDDPDAVGGKAIKCVICGMTSRHADDVAQKYCDNCKIFHQG